MIDASLSQLMTFYDIIIGNPITRSASRSPCRMQSQITCVKTVIECDGNNLSLPIHSLPNTSRPDKLYGFLPDMNDDRLNVNDLKLNWLTGASRQKALFDGASPSTAASYCLHVCMRAAALTVRAAASLRPWSHFSTACTSTLLKFRLALWSERLSRQTTWSSTQMEHGAAAAGPAVSLYLTQLHSHIRITAAHLKNVLCAVSTVLALLSLCPREPLVCHCL